MIIGRRPFHEAHLHDYLKILIRTANLGPGESCTDFMKNRNALKFVENQKLAGEEAVYDLIGEEVTKDEVLADFIKSLMMFNPARRFTVEQALEHPYLSEYRQIEEERVCLLGIKHEANREVTREEAYQRMGSFEDFNAYLNSISI